MAEIRDLVSTKSHHCPMTAAIAELPRVHGRHRNRALAAARRVRAVELKTAGYTYAQVAQELGYTSRGTAYNVVTKALREQTAEAVADLRDLGERPSGRPAVGSVGCRNDRGHQGRCSRRAHREGTGAPEWA